jgi:hypothetical protein
LHWRRGGFVASGEGKRKIVADEALEASGLYNLAVDRAETTDRAAEEPDRLAGRLARLRAHTTDIEAAGPDRWR